MSKTQVALTALVVLHIAALSYFLFFSEDSIKNYPPREGPIVAFGDSLVAGTGATADKNFVSLLSARIGEPIENFGVPGDLSADGLARVEEVLELNPRIALVLLGGNDYLRRVPPEETFANLRTIIMRLQEDGVLVVLLGVRGGILRDNFATSFSSLAKETKSAYVPDVLDGLLGNPSLMADQVHPNDAGHARIVEKVHAVLVPLLR